MIFLYTSLIVLLAIAYFLVSRRAKSLEKKYARVARETDALLKQSPYKEGNSGRLDPLAIARRQYQIGVLAQKRDRVEAKYTKWQGWADRLGRSVSGLRRWKGKKLPYTFGLVDVVCALGLIDYLGFSDYVSVHALVQLITSRFTG
jgi:hypothetical protein